VYEVVRFTVLRFTVAVTDWLAFMVTLQVPVPEQAPDQPANVDPTLAVGVRVIFVPEAYV
jgi:hypothetical protein